MGRVEKTVFISYRRTDESWGLAIFQDLTQHGYDVFLDHDGIASGRFGDVIFESIRARAHFLVLLTPTALERSSDPEDWMRREIEAALDSQRNIVPLMLEGFDFGTPAIASQLSGKLAALKEYNGLEIPAVRFFSAQMKLLRKRFLNVPVDAVLHPASDSAQQVAKEQKDKATMAEDIRAKYEKWEFWLDKAEKTAEDLPETPVDTIAPLSPEEQERMSELIKKSPRKVVLVMRTKLEEAIVSYAEARGQVVPWPHRNIANLIRVLRKRGLIDKTVWKLLDDLRSIGNSIALKFSEPTEDEALRYKELADDVIKQLNFLTKAPTLALRNF